MTKKSSEEELKKIHQILDNITIDSSEKNQDQYESSLRQRLSNHHQMIYTSRSRKRIGDSDLTPRVIIRKKEERFTQSKKEEKPVRFQEKGEEPNIIVSPGLDISDDELFEVEHPPSETEQFPEFIEVKPKEEKEEDGTEEEPLTIKISSETDEKDKSLPQWQAIEDTEISERKPGETSFDQKKQKEPKSKELKDTKRTSFFNRGKKKKSGIWEPLDSEEKAKTELNTTSFQDISTEKEEKNEFERKSFEIIDENSKGKNSSTKSKEDKENEKTHSSESQGFQYNDYTLYKKTIIINDEDKRTIHFFAKEPPENGEPSDLPEYYEVKINRKTGVPYIRRKQK